MKPHRTCSYNSIVTTALCCAALQCAVLHITTPRAHLDSGHTESILILVTDHIPPSPAQSCPVVSHPILVPSHLFISDRTQYYSVSLRHVTRHSAMTHSSYSSWSSILSHPILSYSSAPHACCGGVSESESKYEYEDKYGFEYECSDGATPQHSACVCCAVVKQHPGRSPFEAEIINRSHLHMAQQQLDPSWQDPHLPSPTAACRHDSCRAPKRR